MEQYSTPPQIYYASVRGNDWPHMAPFPSWELWYTGDNPSARYVGMDGYAHGGSAHEVQYIPRRLWVGAAEAQSSLRAPQAAGIGFRKEPDTWILRRHRTARRMDGCLPTSPHWATTPNSPRVMSLPRSCARHRLSDSIPQRSRPFSRRLAPEKPTNPLAFRHPESRWRHSAVSRLRKRKVIRFQWK
jgi:hypothetical protein